MDYTYNFIGSINVESTKKLLSFIEEKKEVSCLTININSTGGDVSCAVALYDFLKSQEFSIKTHNLCDVLSAALIVYLAGKERTTNDSSKFLIHPIALNINTTLDYNKAQEIVGAISTDINNYAIVVNKETNSLNNKYDIIRLLKNESIYFDKQSAFDCGIVTQL